jgi:hypothetical protein
VRSPCYFLFSYFFVFFFLLNYFCSTTLPDKTSSAGRTMPSASVQCLESSVVL